MSNSGLMEPIRAEHCFGVADNLKNSHSDATSLQRSVGHGFFGATMMYLQIGMCWTTKDKIRRLQTSL